MSDSNLEEIKELLKSVARAHHEATGGVNAGWAGWYAERLRDPLLPLVDGGPSIDEIAAWLTEADLEYRSEERNVSWPRYYARFILDCTIGD